MAVYVHQCKLSSSTYLSVHITQQVDYHQIASKKSICMNSSRPLPRLRRLGKLRKRGSASQSVLMHSTASFRHPSCVSDAPSLSRKLTAGMRPLPICNVLCACNAMAIRHVATKEKTRYAVRSPTTISTK